MTDQPWCFYIVRCKDSSLYSGISNDVAGRIEKHNTGAGAKYTSGRRPVVLVYSEECGGISEARRREAEVKKWPKQKKERLVAVSALGKSSDDVDDAN